MRDVITHHYNNNLSSPYIREIKTHLTILINRYHDSEIDECSRRSEGTCWKKMQLLEMFTEGQTFRGFNVVESSFLFLGAAREKHVTECCCAGDDKFCLGMFDCCRRLLDK